MHLQKVEADTAKTWLLFGFGLPNATDVPNFINVACPVTVTAGDGFVPRMTSYTYILPTLCVSLVE